MVTKEAGKHAHTLCARVCESICVRVVTVSQFLCVYGCMVGGVEGD